MGKRRETQDPPSFRCVCAIVADHRPRALCWLDMATRPDSALDAATVDDRGIDREQIRAMLRLTPEERLRRVQEFVESVLEIRELNEKRTLR